MPFNNELVCVEMPGRVVSDIVAYTRSGAFKSPAVEYGGFMQVRPPRPALPSTAQHGTLLVSGVAPPGP